MRVSRTQRLLPLRIYFVHEVQVEPFMGRRIVGSSGFLYVEDVAGRGGESYWFQ